MIKGLEALERIRDLAQGDIMINDIAEDLCDIEKELKALEIIIKNLEIVVYHSRHRETGYEMNIVDSDGNDMFTMITKEEYELLKEIL